MQQLNVVAEIPLQFKATWFNWITTSLPLLAKTAGMGASYYDNYRPNEQLESIPCYPWLRIRTPKEIYQK